MTIEEFRDQVLSFYRNHGRTFPWRETRDPYAILVSEIMLQQNTKERVLGKYGPWLTRFPDVETLANAPLGAVLTEWSGLGYNRRARFLHEACKGVAEKGGAFPRSASELEKLPGIGPYTARAVACFAFGSAESFIETNIRTVFLWCFFRQRLETPDPPPVHDAELLRLVEASLDRENPRRWYYALMDYGAALKKQIPNPNRRSAHYVKQSTFRGSLR